MSYSVFLGFAMNVKNERKPKVVVKIGFATACFFLCLCISVSVSLTRMTLTSWQKYLPPNCAPIPISWQILSTLSSHSKSRNARPEASPDVGSSSKYLYNVYIYIYGARGNRLIMFFRCTQISTKLYKLKPYIFLLPLL